MVFLIAGCTFGRPELYYPSGITLNPKTGDIYVSDSSNNRIMQYRYPYESSWGTVVAGGNGYGYNNTQLSNPVGLYFDSSTNSLLIANKDAHNIVRWVLGASNWTLVAGSNNGIQGTTSTLLSFPNDVILDSMGNIYVADGGNSRVQFFLAGQSNGTTIAGVTATPGGNAILLSSPSSLVLDRQLNLYVSDTGNQRVQKFTRL
ncbi:unnamed protein product [Rotaria sp. Silwood1]|nr:unnamed protein product [Rotaria sp. Silwood1]